LFLFKDQKSYQRRKNEKKKWLLRSKAKKVAAFLKGFHALKCLLPLVEIKENGQVREREYKRQIPSIPWSNFSLHT